MHSDGRIQDVCHWYEVALTGTDFANIYAAGIGDSGDTSDGLASGESWTVQSALGGDGWSVRVDYATQVAEGQITAAASTAAAVFQIQLGEGAAAGDVPGGTQATVSQLVTRLLASVSFPPAATYAVSVGEGGIAVDDHEVNQSLPGQLIEQALAGQATTGVTVVIEFVRLIQVSGATAKTIGIAGTTSRAAQIHGARSRINQPEGTIA